VRLNLARSYYARADFSKSIQEYKKIPNTSNYFASTLVELSWAYVMRHQYSEAVGTAYNLVAGGLRSAFSPDAPVAMSIAYFETCNYPQAYQGLRYFRRIYEKSYNWLKNWGEQSHKNAAPELYESVVAYIKDKKGSALPSQVGSELLRSPVLVADQQEINLLFDERSAIKKYVGLLAKMKDDMPSRAQQTGSQALRNTMLKFSADSGHVQTDLVAQINTDLAQRANLMVKQLNASVENIQLVEIEIYNSAGEDMILENARPELKEEAKQARERATKNHRTDGPVLDWGRFPARDGESGKAEIWQDELGALKTDIADVCPKK
jgi:tetratricopeptide (TPR) repeat protein